MGKRSLRFVILGAGALGSILGAHLARARHPVLMLARGRRAAQVAAEGLRIRDLAEFDQAVPLLVEPERCPDADVLIVATKTHATAATLEPLRAARFEAVLSVQNGVLKNELLARAFGRERVIGALADSSGELAPDGIVRFTRNECIALGELRGGGGERAAEIAQALEAAGIASRAVDDIESLEWCKFTAWAALMIVSVTTRACTPVFLADPDAARVLVRLVREMGALALAAGFALSDRVTLPVATLCNGPEAAAVEIVCGLGQAFALRAPTHRMSSLQDLEAGRALEIEETLGDAVRRARELGLSLPLLGMSHALVSAIDRIRRTA